MSHLNPEQHAAIRYIDGPLLVIAGAGSGKTRVITQKIAYLIEECQYAPKHIYAVTFTNKAAREMAARTQKLLAKNKMGKVNVSTFHSLGIAIIKKEAGTLNLNENFTLFDSADSISLLKELSGQVSAVSDDNLGLIQQSISNWKNDLLTPAQALSQATSETTHLAARFYVAYESTLRAYNAVDFDDLIALPVKLFQEEPAVLERWQNYIRYLLVDEYQDTNTAQYTLIKLLAGVRGAFTVVGDDDQSIYAWRGAKPENIQLLQSDYTQLKVIKLEQNYRSVSNILQAANRLIANNPHTFEKALWSTLGPGDPIRVIACPDGENEVERVIHEILAHQFRYRLTLENYAILYRSNHQAKSLEQALRLQGLPYQISGGTSFFARTEIKDLFAYFRLMVNPLDDSAFLRCVNTPKRDIGPATLEKLGTYAKQRNTSLLHACFEMGLSTVLPSTACDRLHAFATHVSRTFEQTHSDECLSVLTQFIDEIGYLSHLLDTSPSPHTAKKRQDNVQELINWLTRLISEQENPLTFSAAIQKMLLVDLLDRQSSEKPTQALQLMTLHAAKGLEFPHVFIIGWEEETLPHKNSIELETIEEERRLAYVGMTRAKSSLTLTYAKQRRRYGEASSTVPSRFLEELPEELLEWEGLNNAVSEEASRAKGQAQLTALKAMLQEIPL